MCLAVVIALRRSARARSRPTGWLISDKRGKKEIK